MTRTYTKQGKVGKFKGKISRLTKETVIKIKLIAFCLIGCGVGYAAGYSHLKFW